LKRIQIARRAPLRTIQRQRITIAEQAATIKMLQEEFGSLLDLSPLVDFTEGADTETIKWVMGGSFLPHIAALMASTLLAFDAHNVCEWHLIGDPRGEFVLTIQRKAGKTPAELRAEALDKAQRLETRMVALLWEIGTAYDAYADGTGTLEQLLDAIDREMQAAKAPLRIAIRYQRGRVEPAASGQRHIYRPRSRAAAEYRRRPARGAPGCPVDPRPAGNQSQPDAGAALPRPVHGLHPITRSI
jgi:hypothetical protein